MEIGNLQFSYTANADSFKKASDEVKKRLEEQEKEIKKSEKSFLTLNKVVLASGVSLGILASKKLPKVKAGFTAFAKGGGQVLTSLEKIALATKGVFGPFAKMGTAITGLTIGFETADFAMSAMGVSTAGVIGSFIKMGGVMSGVLAVGLTSFISLTQSAADTLGNALLSKSREWLEVGAGLETQTFALSTSLKQYRDATGDASVTTESMVSLLNDLGQTTGLTRQQLKGGLTTMLNLSRVTGLTSEQIKVLIKRSADMSVALGADFNDVVLAIDQSFKGYNERLLNFGVNITQATLAQTKFVSTQGRTVDSLSSAQLVTAKYEDILGQTSNTSNSLTRANNTLQGSALTLELAFQSLQNRMGEATQEVFGPAIVAINQMKTSIVNLAGKGGVAGLTATVIGFGGVLFKGIAFILKWGSLLVILREAFKLLSFAVRNASKIIGVFAGALEFLSQVAATASVVMANLAATTTAFQGAAQLASSAAGVLSLTSKGLGVGAKLTGKAAEAATKKFSVLTGGVKLFSKIIKPLFGILARLTLTFFKWGGVIGLIAGAVLALGGVVTSIVKTFLSLIGIDLSSLGTRFKSVFDNIKKSLISFTQFIVTIPQKIFLSMELLTTNITIGVLKVLKAVGLFAGKLQRTIDDLKQEAIDLREELSSLGKGSDEDAGAVSSNRDFKESKEFLKLQAAADIRRIESFNAEEGILRRINLVSDKRNQIAQDLQNIISPEISKQKELLKLKKDQGKLLDRAKRSSPEGVARNDARIFRARLKNLRIEAKGNRDAVANARKRGDEEGALIALFIRKKGITKDIAEARKVIAKFDDIQLEKSKKFNEAESQILKIKESISQIGKATPAQIEEVTRLRKQDLELAAQERDLKIEQNKLEVEFIDIKKVQTRIIEFQSQAEAVQGKNRITSLSIEREILKLEQKRLIATIAEAKFGAGKEGLGKLKSAQLELEVLRLKKQELTLISKEKALRRSIIDELGPLNAKFQENRLEDLRNFQQELISARVSSEEIARVTAERIRSEQLALWASVVENSNDSLQILRGKLILYFESTSNLAKKTAEIMFDVFTNLEDALSSTLSNIATGVSSLSEGFKDFKDAIVNIVVSSLIRLGVEQVKGFLIQKSGILKSIQGLRTEGTAVDVLASQYRKLAVAKSQSNSAAGASSISFDAFSGGSAPIGPRLPNGAFVSANSGQIGPRLPNGSFNSGTGGGAGQGLAGGLGAIGGGLLGSAIGGETGGQAGSILGGLGAAAGFAFGGPLGAIAGGLVGSAVGGLFGRSKKKRKKRERRAARKAQKEIEDLAEAIENGALDLDVALSRVTEKIRTNTRQAREAWEGFKKELERQRKAVIKQLKKTSDSIKDRIAILGTDRITRGTVSELQSLSNEIEDLQEQFKKLPSAVTDSAAQINKLFTASIKGMIEELDQLVKEQVKSFEKGARDDAGNLVSVVVRANLDITKLFKVREKLTKDFNKSIKDIENEGIAQRQKTIQKDKEERIAELTKKFNESKLDLDNQISTIRIVTSERSAANAKALEELEAQRVAIESAKAADAARVAQELADINSKIKLLQSQKQTAIDAFEATNRDLQDLSNRPLTSFGGEPRGNIRPADSGSETRRLKAARREEELVLLAEKRKQFLLINELQLQLDTVSSILQALVPPRSFGSGGPVTQTGLAKVHEGEFVIQEKFASRLTPLLESLNKGQIPSIQRGSGGFGGNADFSIKLVVGSVDSPDRVRQIESIVKNLQKKQLFRVRQVTGV